MTRRLPCAAASSSCAGKPPRRKSQVSESPRPLPACQETLHNSVFVCLCFCSEAGSDATSSSGAVAGSWEDGPGFHSPTPKGCECRGNGKSPMQTAAHPSKASRDAAPCPPPCPGKELLGTGTGARCCHNASGPAASISIEVFPELWSNSEVQVAQALSVHWEIPCSCSGPLAHCCALDTIALTSFTSMRTGRKAVDASVSSRQKVCNIKCRRLSIQPAE